MNKDLLISNTCNYVKEILEEDCSGHDWWHTYRVWKLATFICEKEKGDQLIVQLASLLHDIADYKFHGGDEKLGVDIAKEWLIKQNISKDRIRKITNILLNMSFKGSNVSQPNLSLEGRIVQDADRLDALGAIGIARAFAYGGYKGHVMYDPNIEPINHSTFEEYKKRNSPTINHFHEKLLLLADKMGTDTGKRIALKRHNFIKEFLKEFFNEWKMENLF